MNDVVLLNGNVRCLTSEVTIPWAGAWTAVVTLEPDATIPTGRVTLTIGTATLVGTVAPTGTGRFIDRLQVTIIGGGAGWSRTLRRKPYQNGASVKRSTIAEDLAREAGENFDREGDSRRVGVDFPRCDEQASGVLSLIYPGWRVDLDGVTRATPRETYALATDGFEVLSYDPDSMTASCIADDLSAIRPGAVITDSRFGSLLVRHVVIRAESGSVSIRACGGEPVGSRLLSALRRAVHDPEERFFGQYRYVVIAVHDAGNYIECRCASRVPGLPDMLPIRVWPGIGGARTRPVEGSTVVVSFLDGDRTQPGITSFQPLVNDLGEPQAIMLRADSITLDAMVSIPVEEVMAQIIAIAEKRFVRYGDQVIFLTPGPGVLAPGPGGTMSGAKGS